MFLSIFIVIHAITELILYIIGLIGVKIYYKRKKGETFSINFNRVLKNIGLLNIFKIAIFSLNAVISFVVFDDWIGYLDEVRVFLNYPYIIMFGVFASSSVILINRHIVDKRPYSNPIIIIGYIIFSIYAYSFMLISLI